MIVNELSRKELMAVCGGSGRFDFAQMRIPTCVTGTLLFVGGTIVAAGGGFIGWMIVGNKEDASVDTTWSSWLFTGVFLAGLSLAAGGIGLCVVGIAALGPGAAARQCSEWCRNICG